MYTLYIIVSKLTINNICIINKIIESIKMNNNQTSDCVARNFQVQNRSLKCYINTDQVANFNVINITLFERILSRSVKPNLGIFIALSNERNGKWIVQIKLNKITILHLPML